MPRCLPVAEMLLNVGPSVVRREVRREAGCVSTEESRVRVLAIYLNTTQSDLFKKLLVCAECCGCGDTVVCALWSTLCLLRAAGRAAHVAARL